MINEFITLFKTYHPPKQLRLLFIVHYAPLLLIILIGPLSPMYKIWMIPIPWVVSILLGISIFLLGAYVYFSWEWYWQKQFHGQLVTSGIFKHIRHPHYTSLLIIGFGLALFFYSLASLIIAGIAIPIMIWSILDEEHYLLKEFGEEYKTFMKTTPWRLIPKIF